MKYAVLIDADNISEKYIKTILDEISNDGTVTYKRIYGDWTNTQLKSWKSVLLDHSVIPIQQYSYTSGKSSTDSAMIIDAMDILYSGKVDGFCLASSDSDFTRLAARLRESGMQVIGMGESKTPKPFITACNQFRYLDILYANLNKKDLAQNDSNEATLAQKGGKQTLKQVKSTDGTAIQPQTGLATIEQAIQTIIEEGSDEEGWMFSGELGGRLAKRYPDFDVRNYGYQKLTPFIHSLGNFEIRTTPAPGNNAIQLVYVRAKPTG